MGAVEIFKSAEGRAEVMRLYDQALANWPVPYRARTVETRHGSTFVIDSGDEALPPLVLLHGAGSASAVWVGEVADYARHFRVCAVDLVGEAGKSAPNRPPWDGPAYAEWLADVLNGLELPRPHLLGISQGGWTALKFAVTHPARVERLILLTPSGVIPTRSSFLPRAMVSMMLGRWGMRRMMRAMFADQPVPDGAEETMITIMHHFKHRVEAAPVFTGDELRRLTMPVLLVIGDRDIVSDTERVAARLGELLPQLEVVRRPGAGHSLMNTAPRVVEWLLAAEPAPVAEPAG